jgi:hypothetical protein
MMMTGSSSDSLLINYIRSQQGAHEILANLPQFFDRSADALFGLATAIAVIAKHMGIDEDQLKTIVASAYAEICPSSPPH